MSDNQQLMETISECQLSASQQGHHLGRWHKVDERLHASLCEVCNKMAWVSLSANEAFWRIGGATLNQECSREDLEGDRRSVFGT
jgi:hypothetical protein